MRTLFVLAFGLFVGYTYGFKDGKNKGTTIAQRVVDRVGGSSRGKYKTDVDAQMTRAEQAR